jgi:hypothetical protein
MVEAVPDGLYMLTWEMVSPGEVEWRPVWKEHRRLAAAESQKAGLLDLAEQGELIRNVDLQTLWSIEPAEAPSAPEFVSAVERAMVNVNDRLADLARSRQVLDLDMNGLVAACADLAALVYEQQGNVPNVPEPVEEQCPADSADCPGCGDAWQTETADGPTCEYCGGDGPVITGFADASQGQSAETLTDEELAAAHRAYWARLGFGGAE